MDKIAVFIEHNTINNSPSIINLLDFLSDIYEVHLFLRHIDLKKATVLDKKNIKVIDLGNRRISPIYLIEKIKSRWNSFNHYICIDPHGFVLCKKLFPKARPIYYSLELYMKDDYFGLYYPKHIMNFERKNINSIKALVIQSEEKEILFRKDYNLSNNIPSLLIPVTYQGPSVREKATKVRDKYQIGSDKKIALHLGGIAEWFSCIELAVTFSKLEKWALFFQGYSDQKYLAELTDTLVRYNINNVFISDEIYDSVEDIDPIIMSCDLGIAWYNDISIGFRTAGKSSGKIAGYLRFGLPVIAKKYLSTIEAIEDTGCGICVDDFEEISTALKKVEEDFNRYSENAANEYNKTYRFENYKERLISLIENG